MSYPSRRPSEKRSAHAFANSGSFVRMVAIRLDSRCMRSNRSVIIPRESRIPSRFEFHTPAAFLVVVTHMGLPLFAFWNPKLDQVTLCAQDSFEFFEKKLRVIFRG